VLRTARALPDCRDLMLAVETEKLLGDDQASADGMNRLTGTVTDIVYQGESIRVFIALAGNASVSLRQPSHHVARGRIPSIGAQVSLHPEDTIVVPASTE
jgi:putative spermidine/putrescine transport system ATP-binding protein